MNTALHLPTATSIATTLSRCVDWFREIFTEDFESEDLEFTVVEGSTNLRLEQWERVQLSADWLYLTGDVEKGYWMNRRLTQIAVFVQGRTWVYCCSNCYSFQDLISKCYEEMGGQR
ncbi:hypothetical protein IC617_08930 [Neiella sp. HB171785]|uniref:Uncharacterized protein n=1 Tax=Neiella litorisoli TaxID=2771431 RepID=A0A8J6UG38_9GAMM|nr:hypothetical protein [Neiella litorisoli]MBD1389551.1 hypothetical protein [Neiella litorisoli]